MNFCRYLLGQSNIPPDKEAKRAKQAEYVRQLQQDGNSGAMNIQPHHHQQFQGGGGGLFPGNNGGELDDKAIKRAKQQEYQRQLQQDNPQSFQKNHQYQQHSAGSGGGGGYDFGAQNEAQVSDAKAHKRAKQAEYNRQLQEHENLRKQNEMAHNFNQQNQLKGYHNQGQRWNEHTNSNGSLPDAGWEMGPLGQPVRKTLAVGNRGEQKAYTTKKHSPRKPDVQSYSHAGQNGGMGFGQNDGFQGQQGFGGDGSFQQGGVINNGLPGGGGGVGGGGANLFGAPQGGHNNAQSEYARAIEEQIRLKKVSM